MAIMEINKGRLIPAFQGANFRVKSNHTYFEVLMLSRRIDMSITERIEIRFSR
jgi:hypothetical protein